VVRLDRGIADCPAQVHPGLFFRSKGAITQKHAAHRFLYHIFSVLLVADYPQDEAKPFVAMPPNQRGYGVSQVQAVKISRIHQFFGSNSRTVVRR
jgi:hypothetical protein